jgi:hypothetical protein
MVRDKRLMPSQFREVEGIAASGQKNEEGSETPEELHFFHH